VIKLTNAVHSQSYRDKNFINLINMSKHLIRSPIYTRNGLKLTQWTPVITTAIISSNIFNNWCNLISEKFWQFFKFDD